MLLLIYLAAILLGAPLIFFGFFSRKDDGGKHKIQVHAICGKEKCCKCDDHDRRRMDTEFRRRVDPYLDELDSMTHPHRYNHYRPANQSHLLDAGDVLSYGHYAAAAAAQPPPGFNMRHIRLLVEKILTEKELNTVTQAFSKIVGKNPSAFQPIIDNVIRGEIG